MISRCLRDRSVASSSGGGWLSLVRKPAISLFRVRLALAVDELVEHHVARDDSAPRHFLQRAAVEASGLQLVGEVDGAAGEELNEVRPSGCLRVDPRDAAFPPKAGIETRAGSASRA